MQSSIPYTPPPPLVTYIVSVNGEEPQEFATAPKASKLVADNLAVGYPSTIAFHNATSVDVVRSNFEKRIDGWLRQVGYTSGFRVTATTIGAIYEPPF
jgi:hypothetical protein